MFGIAFSYLLQPLHKGFEIKISPLVEQFLGGAQDLPSLLSRVEVSDPRRKKEVAGLYTWSISIAAGD
jgi:hypothetical protein